MVGSKPVLTGLCRNLFRFDAYRSLSFALTEQQLQFQQVRSELTK